MSRFDKTYCSQCGGEFGPGDEGFSYCSDHARTDCLPVPTTRNQGLPGIYAVLYTDTINGEQTSRDDLWIATTAAIRTAIDKAHNAAYAEGRKDEQYELSGVLPGTTYMDPPDGGAPVKLVGCGGGIAGDCWRVKA